MARTNERLLRVKEVQEITGFGKNKTYEDINSKRLPSLRIGNSIRVPESALLAWIARNTQGGEVAQ